MTTNEGNRIRFGPYEVDLHTRELWKFGTRLRLVGQPFEILAMLLQRPRALVTREEMRTRLWPADTFVDFNHSLNAAVNKLREALSDSADEPRYIETLPRRGYRFVGKIEAAVGAMIETRTETKPEAGAFTHEPVPMPAPVEVAVPAGNVPPPAILLPAQKPRESWRSLGLVAAAAFVMVVALGAIVLHRITGGALASAPSVERTRQLLPIANTFSPSFSPDGNFVAFVREGEPGDPGIFVSRVGSDQLQQLTRNRYDCCPVWSSDGRWIAFTRMNDHEHSIYVIPADGGKDRKYQAEKSVVTQSAAFTSFLTTLLECKLDTKGVLPQRGEMDWSPDGKLIAFAGPSGIYALNADASAVRRVEETPPGAEDWGPQFSPDGAQLLFIRNHSLGQPDEIWSVPVAGGQPSRILSEPGRITGSPQWSYDARSVIYSSNRTGHPALFRASLDAPDSVVELKAAGSPAWDPTISRHGYRLAYDRLMRALSIWQMDLSGSSDKHPFLLVAGTSDTDQGPGPQFSPDGKKLAYMSDRSGTMEIWIANRDGSNPFQLTAVGGAGTPRWSPDSDAVVFDAGTTSGEKVVTMSLRGGAPQVLADGLVPSWSHDGKWVYFASEQTEGRQVWKVPSGGGMPVQVTQHGGHAALESLDGKYIYYSKNAQAEPEIWRVPVTGGEETPVPLIRPGTWASFQVVEGGVLFVGPALGHQAVLNFYDAAHNRTSSVAVLDRIPFWLGATADGRTVAFDQPGREQTQTMLVENFH